MNYPNMTPEILEAVHLMYEDEPDVEVDCLRYLGHLGLSEAIKLGDEARLKLLEMGRCPQCGSFLEITLYKEPHPELDSCPYETLSEEHCPVCDFGKSEDY